MEIMLLRKGSKMTSARTGDKSEADISGNDNTKDSENVAASYSFLPQLPSGRQLAKKNL